MSSKTPYFGLDYFGPGVSGSITDDGGKYTLGDRLFIDRILRSLTLHDHAGDDVQLLDPSGTPGTSLDTTSGQIPGGLNVFYRVSYIDKYGLETAASPEVVVATPAPLAVPDFPSLAAAAISDSDTNPGLGVDTFLYALTATAGAQETPLGLAAEIDLDGSLTTVVVSYPAVQDSQDGWSIWRKGSHDPGFTRIGTGALDDVDFTDDGATAADPDAADPANSPPTTNLTNSVSAITVGVPDPDLLEDDATPVLRWRLYRSYSSGSYAASSLVAEINTAINPDGTGGIVTEYDDDGSVALQPGQPLDVSQTTVPATKLRFIIVATADLLPDPTLLPQGYPALVGSGASIALYVISTDQMWHEVAGGGGGGGGGDGSLETYIYFSSVPGGHNYEVYVDDSGELVTQLLLPGAPGIPTSGG